MSLSADQVVWLNRVAGSALPVPDKEPEHDKTGGTPPTPPKGPLTRKDIEEKARAFLAARLVAKNETEDFAAEQSKTLDIENALRAIAPMKTKMRMSNDIVNKTEGEVYTFLNANREDVGDVRDVKANSVLGRADLGESGFDPETDGKKLEELRAKVEKAEKEGKSEKVKKDQEALKEISEKKAKLDKIVQTINKDAMGAFELVESLRADLERRTRVRSVLDLPKSLESCVVSFEKDGKFAATDAVFIPVEEKLFTTNDLINELFTPLVNERVLAENFVRSKYSKTQIMLDATTELYKRDLKDAKDPVSGLAAFSSMAINIGSGMAGALMSVAGVNSSMATGLLTGCTALAQLTVTAADKLPDQIDEDTVKSLMGGLPNIIGGMIGAATGNTGLGNLVGASSNLVQKATFVVIDKARGKTVDASAMIGLFTAAFDVALTDIGNNAKTTDQQGNEKLIKDAGDAVGKIAGASADKFYEAIRTGDKRTLRSLTLSICLDVVTSTAGMASDIYSRETTKEETLVQQKQETTDLGKTPEGRKELATEKSDQSAVTDGGTEATTIITGLQSIVEKSVTEKEKKPVKDDSGTKSKEELAELRKRIQEAAEEEFDALEGELAKSGGKKEPDLAQMETIVAKQMKDEAEEFQKELAGLNDPLIDEKAISKLMAKIERDRTIMQVAIAVAQGGLAVASHFVPQLALATESIKLVANVKAAIDRSLQLRKFVDNLAGAEAANSRFITSIQNFCDNQKNQMEMYAIKAAENGLKLIAAAVATGFPLAAPAVTMVGAVQSGTDAAFEGATLMQVAAAWKVTKEALKDPTNRRLGLKARRLSATLAKYSIAYGASEEKDPVAITVCEACGLKPDALKSKEAGTDKIKQYMETKLVDDPKVVGKFDQSVHILKKLPEAKLETKVVFRAYQVLSDGGKGSKDFEKAFGKSVVPAGKLVGYLQTWEKQKAPEESKTPTAEDVEAMQARLLLAGSVAGALREEADRLEKAESGLEDAIAEYVSLADAAQETLSMSFLRMRVALVKVQQPTK